MLKAGWRGTILEEHRCCCLDLFVFIELPEFVTHKKQTFKVIMSRWNGDRLDRSDGLVSRGWP